MMNEWINREEEMEYTRDQRRRRGINLASKANEGGMQTEELVQLCNWREKGQQYNLRSWTSKDDGTRGKLSVRVWVDVRTNYV